MDDALPLHVMDVVTPYPGEAVFTCTEESCGRQVVVRPGSLVVLQRGEFYARHVGATGGVSLRGSLGS
jgi:hypothetical protein